MCDVNLPTKSRASNGKHGTEYTAYSHDVNGQRYAHKVQSRSLTFQSMNDYVNSESEGGYNPHREHHRSPFAEAGNNEYEYEPPGDYYAGAPAENASAASGSVDRFDHNRADDHSASADAARTSTWSESIADNEWSIQSERGMRAPLAFMFSGSLADFAAEKASVTQACLKSGAQAGASAQETFKPTVAHFNHVDLKQDLRHPSKIKSLSSPDARAIAVHAQQNNGIVPLGVHVRSYHNPLPFPVGVRASYDGLNQVRVNNSKKFMMVLMPGGTHETDTMIDLRDTIDHKKIRLASSLSKVNPSASMMSAGKDSPFVMVENGSVLFNAINTAGKRKGIPVEWDKCREVDINGTTYINNIPRAAAVYAIDRLAQLSRSTHATLPLDKVSFTIHPLNYQQKWNGHHLSHAAYDLNNNPAVYEEFMNRAVDIVVDATLVYL